MTDTVRAFIALELSPQIKDELAQIEAELKASRADVKWVNPNAIHITLKFLGNISPSPFPLPEGERVRVRGRSTADVKHALDTVASRHKKFTLSLFQIGGFPKLEYPRVIWVGLDKGCSQAEALAKDVEEELTKIGFDKEDRPFTAHLTLGRVKSPKGIKDLVAKIKTLDFKPSASCVIDKITLFQSTLTPQGSIYTPLHEAMLK